jgi:hypothetical protein
VLHFSEEGIFWECQAIDATDWDEDLPSEIGYTMGRQHIPDMNLDQWFGFIEYYSASDFTQPTDRLIALSSIAKSVPFEPFGNTYYAGIWGKHLWRCLAWCSKNSCSAISRASCLAIAPSWSWASVPGQISYTVAVLVEPSECWVELEEIQTAPTQDSNSYGNLKGTSLKLLARVCDIALPTEGKNDRHEGSLDIPDILHLRKVHMVLEWDETREKSVSEKIYAVVPLGMEYDRYLGTSDYNALVLTLQASTDEERTSGICEVYRRIGYVEITCHAKETEHGLHEQSERYERPDPHLLFDILLPNTTLRTILIV